MSHAGVKHSLLTFLYTRFSTAHTDLYVARLLSHYIIISYDQTCQCCFLQLLSLVPSDTPNVSSSISGHAYVNSGFVIFLKLSAVFQNICCFDLITTVKKNVFLCIIPICF